MNRTHARRGFTLIELVVVLAVLALVTHLAVRELSHLRDSRLGQAADRQLEEIRDAVWCERAGAEPSGFLADMGRLPRAVATTNGTDALSASLRELWACPAGVGAYALRAATPENLVGPTNDLADAEIRVGCGWRGPYVRLPLGAERLVDAWGNRLENHDDAGYDRLLDAAGAAVAAGGDVWRVRHLGADGRLDADAPADAAPALAARRDAEVSFLPAGGLTNLLSVSATFVGASGPRSVDGDVQVRWYAPCGSAITGAVQTVSLAGGAVASCVFESVPPGVATVAVLVGGRKRALERVVVPPGGRDVAMKVFVP